MVISLNAATRSTYNRDMVHGDFDRTVGAVRAFIAALPDDDRQKINMHFVAHRANFHEIPDFVRLAHELGSAVVSIGHYLINMVDHEPYSPTSCQARVQLSGRKSN